MRISNPIFRLDCLTDAWPCTEFSEKLVYSLNMAVCLAQQVTMNTIQSDFLVVAINMKLSVAGFCVHYTCSCALI